MDDETALLEAKVAPQNEYIQELTNEIVMLFFSYNLIKHILMNSDQYILKIILLGQFHLTASLFFNYSS
jgi:hypothetical protein